MEDSPKWVAEKRPKKTPFFLKKIKFTPPKFFFCIYLLVMPKYWVKNYFAHGRYPEVGQKQKTEKKKKKERKKRPKVCDNNGQLRIATPPRVAQGKPPGPKKYKLKKK